MLKIGFANIHGLPGKADAVLQAFHAHNIDICLLVETWLSHEEASPLTKTFLNITTVRLNVTRGGRRATKGILGFCRPGLERTLRIVETCPHDNYAIIDTGEALLCVGYFAPSAPHENIQQFLDRALDLANEKPCYIVGDFNARMPAVTGDHSSNPRGQYLEELIQEMMPELTVEEPTEGKYTTFSYSGEGMGITDLLITLNVTATTGLTVHEDEDLGGSDHRLLTFSVDQYTPPERSFSRWDVRNLWIESEKEAYRQALARGQQNLLESMTANGATVENAWKSLCDWINNAANVTIGEVKFNTQVNKQFWTAELIRERAKIRRETAELTFNLRNGDRAGARRAARIMNASNREYREKLKLRKQEMFRRMAEDRSQPGQATALLKMMSCIKRARNRDHCRLDPNNMSAHADHFLTTFGGEPAGEEAPWVIPEEYSPATFSILEVAEQLKRLPNGKATGPDNLFAEMLKLAPECTVEPITVLLNLISQQNSIPEIWKQAGIMPIFKKKGSDLDIANYRPIALTCIVRRLYERLLLKELEPFISRLSPAQGGFRKKRSTLDQAFILEEIMLANPETTYAFLDLKAAYDTVNRRRLWYIMHTTYAIPKDTIARLQTLFDDNKAILYIGNAKSDPIPCKRGLLQGSSLSPILFNFFIDPLLQRLHTQPRLKLGSILSNSLAFADDLELHAKTEETLEELLKTCEDWAHNNGMRFHPNKCQVLGPRRTENATTQLQLHGTNLPRVLTATYLGFPFDRRGIIHVENFRARTAKARQVADLLNRNGMNITGFAPEASSRLFKSFIRPIMEYGLQMRLLPKAKLVPVQRAQNAALRKIFSCHRNTSIRALHKLLQIPMIQTRNEILTTRYFYRVANLLPRSFPASRAWANAVQRRNPQSATFAVLGHPVWPTVRHRAMVGTHLTTTKPSLSRQVCVRWSDASVSQLKTPDPDRAGIDVAGAILYDPPEPIRHCLRAGALSTPRQKVAIYRWLVGNVAIHMPCIKCTGPCGAPVELSRIHAVQCSGAETLLRSIYPDVVVPDQHNLISTLLNTFRNAPPDDGFYENLTNAICSIWKRCLGFVRLANGHWAPPHHDPP
jgi:hypothetical protein